MSAGRGKPSHLTRVVERYIRPISVRLIAVLQEGIASGEFRPVDAMQFAPSIAGMIVHYFVVAPVARKLFWLDPFSSEALAATSRCGSGFHRSRAVRESIRGVKLAAKWQRAHEVPAGSDRK